jgi:hypothetical protein
MCQLGQRRTQPRSEIQRTEPRRQRGLAERSRQLERFHPTRRQRSEPGLWLHGRPPHRCGEPGIRPLLPDHPDGPQAQMGLDRNQADPSCAAATGQRSVDDSGWQQAEISNKQLAGWLARNEQKMLAQPELQVKEPTPLAKAEPETMRDYYAKQDSEFVPLEDQKNTRRLSTLRVFPPNR